MLKKAYVLSTILFSSLFFTNLANANQTAEILKLQDEVLDLKIKLGALAKRNNFTKGNANKKTMYVTELESLERDLTISQNNLKKRILELQQMFLENELAHMMTENSANE